MEQTKNGAGNQDKTTGSQAPLTEKEKALTEKVNVDEQAIQEARDAVGNDEDKIKEYLINNRGL